MRLRRLDLPVFVLVATICIAGCGSTWVDVETTGCSPTDVEQLMTDGPHGKSEMMGVGICKAHGMHQYAGKWRCKGRALQVACK